MFVCTVVDAFECPARADTVFISTPATSCKVMFVCLSECRVTFVNPACSNIFLNHAMNILGLYCISVSFLNNASLNFGSIKYGLCSSHQILYSFSCSARVVGMPEVVEEYLKNKNYDLVKIKQQSILDSYFNDMGKYNKESEIPKTKLVYKNISTQLAKENKKFKYSLIKSGGRANEFANAIEWLCLAGVANQLYRLEQIKLPLNSYKSLDDFKFYMNDVGLCSASQDILIDDILFDNPEFNDFKGGLTENYVNNQLIINKHSCFYWTSGNTAEIDFITRLGINIIPIEVKSSDNTRSRSLNEYINKYSPEYSIRISSKNFGFENNIESIPLYAVFCIK